jgi:GntR family transcriptional regulator
LKFAINRSSPIPYYVQVKDALRDWIKQGKWKTGDQLPGEHELCTTFDVSRPVIRQALRELTSEGLIRREKGKGTYVSGPKIKEGLVQRLTGFYQDMVAQGYIPVTKVLTQEVIAATEDIAEHLKLATGDSVIKIERLRFIEDEPMVLVTTFVPYHLCPGLQHEDLTHQSLYAYMERSCQIILSYGRRMVEAVPASKYVSELLNIRKGSPLILLNSVSYMVDGTPVEYYYAFHRGDRSQFEVELVRVLNGTSVQEVLSNQPLVSPRLVKPAKSPGG